LPVDIVYGTPTPEQLSITSYASETYKLLQGACDQVQHRLLVGHERQKQIYDKRIHGEPFKEDDSVWLLDTATQPGQSKKLYLPWRGPYRVLQKIMDSDYRRASVSGNSDVKIVHFNCLKLCKAGTCFTHQPSVDNEHNAPLISSPSNATAAHGTTFN